MQAIRTVVICIALASSCAAGIAAEPTIGSISLEDLAAGRAKIIDLAHPLNQQTPYWPGGSYHPFELKTIATIERDGVLSKEFSTPEHLGTHIDAPNHFAKKQISVAEIKPENLFGPGVMIDVSGPVAEDADFELTPAHIKEWEATHGQIPDGAIVLLNTGWSRHYGNAQRYQNKDLRERMHFPGFGAEAATFLVKDRNIRGLGLDTMSIDRGLSRDFAVHKIVNGAGRYGLENVGNLSKLPPRDFFLLIAPIKIETGTGGPTRIFAILK
jgi:kynurenine formamidase